MNNLFHFSLSIKLVLNETKLHYLKYLEYKLFELN